MHMAPERAILLSAFLLAVLAAGAGASSAQNDLDEQQLAALELLRQSSLATVSQRSWRTSMTSLVRDNVTLQGTFVLDERVAVDQIVSEREGDPGEFDSYTREVVKGTANGEDFQMTLELSNVGVRQDPVGMMYDDWIRFSDASPTEAVGFFGVPVGDWVRLGSLNETMMRLFKLSVFANEPNFMFNVSRLDEVDFEVVEEREAEQVNGVEARVVFTKAKLAEGFLPVGRQVAQSAFGLSPEDLREEGTYWIDPTTWVILKSQGIVLGDSTNVTLSFNTTATFFDYNRPLVVPDSNTGLDEIEAILGG